MKLAKYTKAIGTTEKPKEYSFIVLENRQDVEAWDKVNKDIRSRQAVGFWIGFKSQNFRATPMDYAAHEEPRNNAIAHILATKISMREEPTSLQQYCTFSDEIIAGMTYSAYKWIYKDQLVRINSVGGMCPIDDLDEYDNVKDISPVQLTNFMVHGDIDYDLKITKKTIVIENDNYTPTKLIESFTKMTGEGQSEVQLINNFKARTILYKEPDYYLLFLNGVKQGLRNILFETTAQDVIQIDRIKQLLEKVMQSFPNIVLNVFAKIPDRSKTLFTTSSPNIKIKIIQ